MIELDSGFVLDNEYKTSLSKQYIKQWPTWYEFDMKDSPMWMDGKGICVNIQKLAGHK